MIDESRVLKSVEEMSALDMREISRLAPLCHICCIEIGDRLREKSSENDGRIIYFAAAKTYYDYLLRYGDDDNVSSIKAGDVTVTGDLSLRLKKAEMLYNNSQKRALPLLTDNDFVFSGV